MAGEKINFIHRDYFDFKHDYLFDEIITNMPVRGKQSRSEMDALYASFFEKSKEILAPGGVMIFYSNEEAYGKETTSSAYGIQADTGICDFGKASF